MVGALNDSAYKLCPWVHGWTVVCLNKIMPAGEHMAVQNFITSFMAFQRYDDSDCRGWSGWWAGV